MNAARTIHTLAGFFGTPWLKRASWTNFFIKGLVPLMISHRTRASTMRPSKGKKSIANLYCRKEKMDDPLDIVRNKKNNVGWTTASIRLLVCSHNRLPSTNWHQGWCPFFCIRFSGFREVAFWCNIQDVDWYLVEFRDLFIAKVHYNGSWIYLEIDGNRENWCIEKCFGVATNLPSKYAIYTRRLEIISFIGLINCRAV